MRFGNVGLLAGIRIVGALTDVNTVIYLDLNRTYLRGYRFHRHIPTFGAGKPPISYYF